MKTMTVPVYGVRTTFHAGRLLPALYSAWTRRRVECSITRDPYNHIGSRSISPSGLVKWCREHRAIV